MWHCLVCRKTRRYSARAAGAARLVEQLNDKAAKLKTGGGETNTTEVQTERNVLDDYDEVAGGESD